VAENSAVGTAVGVSTLRVYVSDPECDNTAIAAASRQQLQWAITGGNTGSVFDLSATTGALTVRTAALDFEGTQAYTLSIQVTDTGTPAQTASSSVTVSVADVNEPPVVEMGQTRLVAENSANGTSVGAALSALDPEGVSPLTWAITAGNNASNSLAFAIGANTGLLSVADVSLLDFEMYQGWTLSVTVTDAAGIAAVSTVVVFVTDVNEAPLWSLGATTTRAVAERSAAGTAVGLPVQFSDPDRLAWPAQTLSFSLLASSDPSGNFQIDANSGAITVKASLLPYASSFASSRQVVTVVATDSGSPSRSARQNITIDVRAFVPLGAALNVPPLHHSNPIFFERSLYSPMLLRSYSLILNPATNLYKPTRSATPIRRPLCRTECSQCQRTRASGSLAHR
jgi:hypothetical protein